MYGKKLKAEIILEHGTWTWKCNFPNKDANTLSVFHDILKNIIHGGADVKIQGFITHDKKIMKTMDIRHNK